MKTRVFSSLLACCMVISLALLTAPCSSNTGASVSNSPRGAAALWNAGNTRDKIVVISDIHLGIDDSYAETVNNRSLLIDFLQRLQSTTDVRELVIGGDFFSQFLDLF